MMMTVCKCIKNAIVTFALATIILTIFIEEYYNKHKISSEKNSKIYSEIANKKTPHQSPPTTSQDSPTTPTNTQTNNPQSSTRRISFQKNSYTIEERHARVSEPLEPAICQTTLSEPQYEPVYNIYPPLQQDLNRARHQSQNQNTLKKTDKLFIQSEIELYKTPEFNSAYFIHLQKFYQPFQQYKSNYPTDSTKTKDIENSLRIIRFNPYI